MMMPSVSERKGLESREITFGKDGSVSICELYEKGMRSRKVEMNFQK